MGHNLCTLCGVRSSRRCGEELVFGCSVPRKRPNTAWGVARKSSHAATANLAAPDSTPQLPTLLCIICRSSLDSLCLGTYNYWRDDASRSTRNHLIRAFLVTRCCESSIRDGSHTDKTSMVARRLTEVLQEHSEGWFTKATITFLARFQYLWRHISKFTKRLNTIYQIFEIPNHPISRP